VQHGSTRHPLPEATVVDLLAERSGTAAELTALVCGDERVDYAGYLGAVAAFARELRELGAAGERVATLIGNSIDGCIAALACLAAGAQQAPLNALLTPHELAPILADAEPLVFVVQAALADAALPVARQVGIEHIIVVGEGARRLAVRPQGDVAWPPLPPLPHADALALLQYTGGTTGRAKGVELTHRAIAVNVAQREALVPTRAGDRILCITPVAHAYGMAMGLLLALNAQGTLVIVPRYQPEVVLDLVARERISVFLGSPTIFVGLLAQPQSAGTDWSHLHTCISGASALAAATLERWRALVGAPVLEGYGMTEAGPVIAFNSAGGAVKPGTVGCAVPGTEIEIVDVESGELVLARGERGEIRVRGPQLMRGYRGRPDEMAAALRDGWLYTGDIGWLDDDGCLAICDRKKDMAKVGGYNVYPREVEEVLFAHPDVVDAAVFGVPDAYRGEALRACVVPRQGAGTNMGSGGDAEALRAFCAERLSRYKVPADFRFMAALPKTAANKTDKAALRRSDR